MHTDINTNMNVRACIQTRMYRHVDRHDSTGLYTDVNVQTCIQTRTYGHVGRHEYTDMYTDTNVHLCIRTVYTYVVTHIEVVRGNEFLYLLGHNYVGHNCIYTITI